MVLFLSLSDPQEADWDLTHRERRPRKKTKHQRERLDPSLNSQLVLRG